MLSRATWNDVAGHIWPAGLEFDTYALPSSGIMIREMHLVDNDKPAKLQIDFVQIHKC